MSHDTPSFDAIAQQLAQDQAFEESVAAILADDRLTQSGELSPREQKYSIEPFINELHAGFADLYTRYTSADDLFIHGRDAYEAMCAGLMLKYNLHRGDMVATMGESVVLILDVAAGETVVYQSTDAVVGALQGPVALDVPDDLNLASLGNIGGTLFRTGLFVANPCLVASNGTVYEPEEFSLGPVTLMTGTAGSRFKKLP